MDFNEGMRNDNVVDLENGSTTSGDDTSDEFSKGSEMVNHKYGKMWRGYVGSERYIYDKDALRSSSCNDMGTREISSGNFETLSDKWMKKDLKKKLSDERYTKITAKKAAKPPRPPKGPSLDALDMKFVREVSELAMMKRARTERMRILSQKKTDKGSSSFGSIFAMLITLIFCYVIIFQGTF